MCVLTANEALVEKGLGFEAFEIMSQLKNSIQVQADDKYRTYEFRDENRKIKNSLPFTLTSKGKKGGVVETVIDQKYIDQLVEKFHENTLAYLTKWLEWLSPIEKWGWVAMKSMPKWDEVEECVDDLIAKKFIDALKEKEIHAEYAHLKPFIEFSISKWKEENVSAQQRWLDVFAFLRTKELPFNNFAILIEYAFTM
ncbi:uncharacterized protein LOC129568444 [Sitodiplosis mosellana]|uniref:uncharacterized protein LOC129568444 n=1 Tax=Sitodiplosis mosellana TaxID=263140 RepID=UPI002444A4D1|nr:uncharacterized protein LOC129568444 [Sitodiplosis mosellana]